MEGEGPQGFPELAGPCEGRMPDKLWSDPAALLIIMKQVGSGGDHVPQQQKGLSAVLNNNAEQVFCGDFLLL